MASIADIIRTKIYLIRRYNRIPSLSVQGRLCIAYTILVPRIFRSKFLKIPFRDICVHLDSSTDIDWYILDDIFIKGGYPLNASAY